MIESQGEFLVSIQQFLAYLNELKSILGTYNVKSITDLKDKIENKEIEEHPTYEDFLDGLSLISSLTSMKKKIMTDFEDLDFESFK